MVLVYQMVTFHHFMMHILDTFFSRKYESMCE